MRKLFVALCVLSLLASFPTCAAAATTAGRLPCGCELAAGEAGPAVTTHKAPPGKAQAIHLRVDLERHRLVLYVGYVPVKEYPVAIGKPATPTPVGEWRVVAKAKWGEGFGSRWMQLSVPWGKYGIHGTNKPWTVGDSVSGGCLRMLNEHVEEVYELVQVGTPVKITGGPLDPLAFYETLEDGYASSRVLLVQRALQRAGYYHGALTGRWDERSQAAAKAFQLAKGLPATGSFDRSAYDALGLALFE
ncbi:MAG: L,D-transpeptidase family protein [Chitinophagales bacterium]